MRAVSCLLVAAAVQTAAAFVAPQGPMNQPSLHSAGKAVMPMEPVQETSSPLVTVAMASVLGLVLGLASVPKVAMAQDATGLDSKQGLGRLQIPKDASQGDVSKVKEELKKAQEALNKNAKSKEERLKIEMEKLRETAASADLTFTSP